jgi:hypothetical protein
MIMVDEPLAVYKDPLIPYVGVNTTPLSGNCPTLYPKSRSYDGQDHDEFDTYPDKRIGDKPPRNL